MPARVSGQPEHEILEHGKLPDPIADAIRLVLKEIEKLEERVKKVETKEGLTSEIDRYLEEKKKEIEKEFEDLTKDYKRTE